jgi:hypothetical protein
MSATFPSRSAVRGEQLLELTDLSPVLDDNGLAHVWDYKVSIGPTQGQPVQIRVPLAAEAHRQLVKQHFERAAFTAIAAFLPRHRDYRPADAGRAAR